MKVPLFLLPLLVLVAGVSQAAWTYDSVAKTLSDGNWTLKVTESSGNLSVTGTTAGAGRLDLSDVETDTGKRVTTIARDVFSNNTAITGFVGPDVVSLGRQSFSKASALEEVHVSPDLASIDYGCFMNCAALRVFEPTHMPQVTTLLGYVFSGCKALSVDFVFENVTLINGRTAFSGAPITSIRMPKCTNIGSIETFSGCTALTNVEFSSALSAIGNTTFYNCKALRTFSPTTLTNCTAIGDNAFGNCTAFTQGLTCPALLTLGRSTFSGSNIRFLHAPNLTTLTYQAFSGCTNLTGDLSFPAATAAIGMQCFNGCKAITSFHAPQVGEIGVNAFNNCKALTNVVLSATCTNFLNGAFGGCSELVHVSPFLPLNLGSDFGYWPGDKRYQGSIYSGCSKLEGPLVIDGDALTNIWQSTFNGCSALTDITIRANNLETISSYAFKNVPGGTDIWWKGRRAPASLGAQAFYPSGTKWFRIHVKSARDQAAWESLCTRTAANLTAADRNRDDFPGDRRLIGVIASNNNYAWVIRWSDGDQTVVTLN
jgi:hypothetical protein